ncbi:MAG: acyl carrier protein [Burkholderiales bacterium]|nr:acyl carrier protein [Burkholderiales bacterium]
MSPVEIHQKLRDVFRDVFDDPLLEITDSTTAADVEDWDSLTHINLIVAAEKTYAVSFTTKEVKALSNVGDFIRLIASRAK